MCMRITVRTIVIPTAGRKPESETNRCYNSEENNKKFFLHNPPLLIMYNEIRYKIRALTIKGTPTYVSLNCLALQFQPNWKKGYTYAVVTQFGIIEL